MKTGKVKRLVANLYNKKELVLNPGLLLRKVHKIIKFDQEVLLKPYIDMNTILRKNGEKKIWKTIFFMWMNKTVFEKSMENIRGHRNIKLVTT